MLLFDGKALSVPMSHGASMLICCGPPVPVTVTRDGASAALANTILSVLVPNACPLVSMSVALPRFSGPNVDGRLIGSVEVRDQTGRGRGVAVEEQDAALRLDRPELDGCPGSRAVDLEGAAEAEPDAGALREGTVAAGRPLDGGAAADFDLRHGIGSRAQLLAPPSRTVPLRAALLMAESMIKLAPNVIAAGLDPVRVIGELTGTWPPGRRRTSRRQGPRQRSRSACGPHCHW